MKKYLLLEINTIMKLMFLLFNDTHREKLGCRLGCFQRFSHVYTINKVLLIPLSLSENVFHQIDGRNEWLLLSVTFTAKFELVFVTIRKHFFLEFLF